MDQWTQRLKTVNCVEVITATLPGGGRMFTLKKKKKGLLSSPFYKKGLNFSFLLCYFSYSVQSDVNSGNVHVYVSV